MNPKLLRAVAATGLSENESKVYLAAASLGSGTAQEIVRLAGVKRTTFYPVFQSLRAYGLMSVELRGMKRRFVAEHPSRLGTLMEARSSSFLESLNELAALYAVKGGESSFRHYAGIESIQTVYDGLLEDVRPGEDYLIISSGTEWYKLAPEYFDKFLARRAKLNIQVRSLLVDSPFGRKYATVRRPNEVSRILSPHVSFTANVVIIPRKVVIHQLKPPVWAVVIENSQIVGVFQQLFHISWASAKAVEKI